MISLLQIFIFLTFFYNLYILVRIRKNAVLLFGCLYLIHFYVRYLILLIDAHEWFYVHYLEELPNIEKLTIIMAVFSMFYMIFSVFLHLVYKDNDKNILHNTYDLNNKVLKKLNTLELISFILALTSLVIYIVMNVSRLSTGKTNYILLLFNFIPADALLYYLIYFVTKYHKCIKKNHILRLIIIAVISMSKGIMIGAKSPSIIMLIFTFYFLIKYKVLKLNLWTFLISFVAIYVACALYLTANSGHLEWKVSLADVKNIIFYTSKRVAGLDSVYLIVDKFNSITIQDYFNPTRYFVEIYRAFTLESMYIPMHELDTYMMGRIFAHIYCNTDITKSFAMEPSLIGFILACFGSTYGILIAFISILIYLYCLSKIKNEFVRFYVAYQMLFLFISGTYSNIAPSIVQIIIFIIALQIFSYDLEKEINKSEVKINCNERCKCAISKL